MLVRLRVILHVPVRLQGGCSLLFFCVSARSLVIPTTAGQNKVEQAPEGTTWAQKQHKHQRTSGMHMHLAYLVSFLFFLIPFSIKTHTQLVSHSLVLYCLSTFLSPLYISLLEVLTLPYSLPIISVPLFTFNFHFQTSSALPFLFFLLSPKGRLHQRDQGPDTRYLPPCHASRKPPPPRLCCVDTLILSTMPHRNGCVWRADLCVCVCADTSVCQPAVFVVRWERMVPSALDSNFSGGTVCICRRKLMIKEKNLYFERCFWLRGRLCVFFRRWEGLQLKYFLRATGLKSALPRKTHTVKWISLPINSLYS